MTINPMHIHRAILTKRPLSLVIKRTDGTMTTQNFNSMKEAEKACEDLIQYCAKKRFIITVAGYGDLELNVQRH